MIIVLNEYCNDILLYIVKWYKNKIAQINEFSFVFCLFTRNERCFLMVVCVNQYRNIH